MLATCRYVLLSAIALHHDHSGSTHPQPLQERCEVAPRPKRLDAADITVLFRDTFREIRLDEVRIGRPVERPDVVPCIPQSLSWGRWVWNIERGVADEVR